MPNQVQQGQAAGQDGGGGRDAATGSTFHMLAAMFIILNLWQAQGQDRILEYAVFLEKQSYGKWDDIVLRYKKTEDEIWTEICIQCKYKLKKSITTENLMSAKKGSFNLWQYLDSYIKIKKLNKENMNRHFLFMTNAKFDFESEYENIKFTKDQTFYKDHDDTLQIIFKNSIFKFNLEDTNPSRQQIFKAVKNTKKGVIDRDIEMFVKELSFCIEQDMNQLKCEIDKILEHICKNDMVWVDIVYSKLQQYIHSMLTDSDFSEMTHLDIERFMSEILYNHSKKIEFNIQDPSEYFTGRTEELEQLKNILQGKKGNSIIDAVISGMAGVGKTQLVLKLISECKNLFNHIICINADSIDNMTQSFIQLARENHLINDSNLIISEIVQLVFNYFKRKGKCLFVFDNVWEDENQFQDASRLTIYNFLPKNIIGSELFIIMTTQNIKFESKIKINLDIFTDNEAIQFLETSLENLNINIDDMKTLIKSLDKFPLALELSASFLKEKIKDEKDKFDNDYTVTNYITELKKTPLIIFQNTTSGITSKYIKNVQKIWTMAISMFLKYEEGKLALFIFNIMTFCSPNGIPNSLFLSLDEREKIGKSFELIRKYSLCKMQEGITHMHSLIQETVRNSQDPKQKNEIIKSGLTLFENYYDSTDKNKYNLISTQNAMKIWNFGTVCEKLVKQFIKIPSFILAALNDLNQHIAALKFGENLISTFDKHSVAKNNPLFILNRLQLCTAKDELHHYDQFVFIEILDILNEIKTSESLKNNTYFNGYVSDLKERLLINLQDFESALKFNNSVLESTIITSDMKIIFLIRRTSILSNLGRNDEAVESLKQFKNICTDINLQQLLVSKLNQLTYGNNSAELYPEILETCTNTESDDVLQISHIYYLCRTNRYNEAIEKIQEQIDKFIEKYGEEHSRVLQLQSFMASIFFSSKGDIEKSISMLNDIQIQQETKLGSMHQDTLETMENKLSCLLKCKKFKESLEICEYLDKTYNELYSVLHGTTLTNRTILVSILFSLNQNTDAYKIITETLSLLEEHDCFKDFTILFGSLKVQASILIGKCEEAELFYTITLDLLKNTPESYQIHRIEGKKKLVQYLVQHTDRHYEACILMKEILKVEEQHLSPDSPILKKSIEKVRVLENILRCKQ